VPDFLLKRDVLEKGQQQLLDVFLKDVVEELDRIVEGLFGPRLDVLIRLENVILGIDKPQEFEDVFYGPREAVLQLSGKGVLFLVLPQLADLKEDQVTFPDQGDGLGQDIGLRKDQRPVPGPQHMQ
jgi:hypothetical protein